MSISLFKTSVPQSLLILTLLFFSCNTEKRPKEVVLYESYCASCHVAPNIQDLPVDLWASTVLPDMAARLGIRTEENHPFRNFSFKEQEAILKSGVYPKKRMIDIADWKLLEEYIISMAPESLSINAPKQTNSELPLFKQIPVALDSVKGSNITYLKYSEKKQELYTGNIQGTLGSYHMGTKRYEIKGQYGNAISDAYFNDSSGFVTTMGKLDPSEIASGLLIQNDGQSTYPILNNLHRPVHTLFHDLNGDGIEEILISEFGNLTGKLTLWTLQDNGTYDRKIVMGQPGIIRVIAKDMNTDGKEDLVVLSSQGDEGITILYQQDDLSFSADKVIRFSPIYGTSWFELVDYNNDGYDDIITVHGDNADKTYVQKPYHGMRIHLNDGQNQFKETFFYPLNGTTRIIAKDFDQDSDIDIALLATFPDYDNYPELSFVYLQNEDAKNYSFTTHTLKNQELGRWFLMDSGDVDKDGDTDIILSSLTYGFTPVPEDLEKQWKTSKTDILILENILN